MSRASAAAASPSVHDAAPLFAALGDETRLRLIGRLSAGGPGSITQLSAKANVSRQAISKHLRVLSDAGLVRSTRRGREIVWDLEPRRIAAAHKYLDHISKQWDDALDRLKASVEG
jgi:DNA-binding transcriptional ArsR family regulator